METHLQDWMLPLEKGLVVLCYCVNKDFYNYGETLVGKRVIGGKSAKIEVFTVNFCRFIGSSKR